MNGSYNEFYFHVVRCLNRPVAREIIELRGDPSTAILLN